MHNKDTVWANIGMRYLVLNACLGRCWHRFVHSPSKFGSYCLGDLAYSENHSCPASPLPNPLLLQTLEDLTPLSSHSLLNKFYTFS